MSVLVAPRPACSLGKATLTMVMSIRFMKPPMSSVTSAAQRRGKACSCPWWLAVSCDIGLSCRRSDLAQVFVPNPLLGLGRHASATRVDETPQQLVGQPIELHDVLDVAQRLDQGTHHDQRGGARVDVGAEAAVSPPAG